MEIDSISSQIQPVGRVLARTGTLFLQYLNEKLDYLDIERSFYALILIDLGQTNLTQQELACQLEIDKVSVVRIVDYLSGRGYVQRIRSSIDRRKYCLTLTGKAKEKLPEIKCAIQEANDTAFKGLNELQRREFISTLGIMKNNLRKV
ncbi:MAG: MarR family transcriptional regulator [Mariniphaga sp.]